MIGHIFSCLLSISLLKVTSCDTTSCRPSVVNPGDPAAVTCYFTQTVDKTNMSVTVHKLDNGNYTIGRCILGCLWVNNGHRCHTDADYVYDGKLSNNLTLMIPHVTEKYVGRYVCQELPSKSRDQRPCMLTLKEREKPWPTEHPTGVKKNAEDDIKTNIIYALIGAITLLVLIFATVALRGYTYRSTNLSNFNPGE